MPDTPFSISPDPNALFLTPTIRSALHRTKYTIEHRQGLALLLGDVGLGKSTVLRYLHAHYSAREDTISRLAPNPQWPSRYAMAKAICQEFGLMEPKRSLVAQQAAFERFLTQQLAVGRNVVLFLDEAQVLAADQLELIRTMLNFETNKEKLIQVVMAGQLDLRDRLLLPKHKALFSRVFAPTLLNPLLYDEMVGMLKARCDLAEIAFPFKDDSLRQIHDYAGGIPREILRTCELAYALMRELGAGGIDGNLVTAVVQEGRLAEHPSKPQPPPLSPYQELMLVAEQRRAEEAAARTAAEQSPAPNLAIVHGAHNATKTAAKPVVNSLMSSGDSSSSPTDDSRLLSTVQIQDLWTAEGASGVFTSSRICRIQQAQDALTHREEKVYDVLWGVKSAETSRLSQMGYTELARRARVDRRTVIRLVERLIDKGYISVAKGPDPRTVTATVYRVLSYGSVLKFQKETGRLWILKTGTGVFYARRLSGPVDDSSSPPVVSSSSPPVDGSAQPPVVAIASSSVVSGARIKEDSKKEGRDEAFTSSSSLEVAAAIRKITPGADDDYISTFVRKCRTAAADVTEDEIAYFVRVKGDQARNSRRVTSLTGFLLEAVPKCLTGTLLSNYRDAKRQEREREIAAWRAILADPATDSESQQIAMNELERLSG